MLSVQLYRNACTLCPQIARHAVLGNSILVLLNALLLSMKVSKEIYAIVNVSHNVVFNIVLCYI